MKKILFWMIALFPILLLVETVSYMLMTAGVPTRIQGRSGHGVAAFYVAQRQKLVPTWNKVAASGSTFGHGTAGEGPNLLMFHPTLGWDFPPNISYRAQDGTPCTHGRDGERRTCTSFDKTTIATYGDSFTYCDQVPDDQTWQTFLGEKLKANVLNFGVSGYGTDQAFLKFHGHGTPRAPIIMLCILPENINRVVNLYRLFYNYEDPLALTKPRFVREGEGFRLIPNPSAQIEQLVKLNDPAYVEELGKLDYWYQFDRNLPKLSFPYLASAIASKSAIFDWMNLSLHSLIPGLTKPRYPFNLFNEPEPFAIMCHIVDLFITEAESRGAKPIIVLMPHKDYVNELMRFRVSRVEGFRNYLAKKKYPFVDLIQAMADLNPSEAQLERWYSGHATAEGNRVVADLMLRYLQTKKMSASTY